MLGEKDIIEIAEISERQIADGECKNAGEFLSELRLGGVFRTLELTLKIY